MKIDTACEAQHQMATEAQSHREHPDDSPCPSVSVVRSGSGFSLIELIIAMGLLLAVSSIVTSALLQMTKAQTTIWNRTEMHSGIRGATELLQQEVGQAGRISMPGTTAQPGVMVLSQAVSAVGGAAPAAATTCDPGTPTTNAVAVNVNKTTGAFATAGPPAAYELFTTLDGNSQELVKIASVNSATSITACFLNAHASGTVLSPLGAFATGIIPPTGIVNGSSATVLKLYGDVIGDGNMVYIEYTCDTVAHNLYRNVMAYDAGSKPAVTNSQILLSNIIDNPGGTPCFTYQTTSLIAQGTTFTFVLDVAVTLTVQTEQIDPVTRVKQTETKALLNVSPRNVFTAWEMASLDYTDHVQSTPVTVTALLP
jgi:type II secretory pathway pseudopilin PulG